jgi:hypothetical protein
LSLLNPVKYRPVAVSTAIPAIAGQMLNQTINAAPYKFGSRINGSRLFVYETQVHKTTKVGVFYMALGLLGPKGHLLRSLPF